MELALARAPHSSHDSGKKRWRATLATWGEFAAAAPTMAEQGRALLYRGGRGRAFLATVREGSPPRVHPISVELVGDRLVAVILPSAKGSDLLQDGRFALHAHQDPEVPHEFVVRGRARLIDDPSERDPIAGSWVFEVGERDYLFEFDIEHAVHGERASADDWPPAYTSWRDPAA